MILSLFHWFGALLVLVTMWAAVQFDGRPLDSDEGCDGEPDRPRQRAARSRSIETLARLT